MLKRLATLYSRICWYIVTRLFPLTAEQIWSQGFVKGAELAQDGAVWTHAGEVYPERGSGLDSIPSYWSGSA